MKQTIMSITLLLIITCNIFAQQRPISALLTERIEQSGLSNLNLSLSQAPESEKSVFLAVVASLLVPGMGELYSGSFETGKYHLIAEGGLWLAYSGIRMHSNRLLQDAKTFAGNHAGADFNNKDDQYLVNIGNYNTTEEYNDAKSRNREYDFIYQPAQQEYKWSWDTEANRNKFKDLRIRSSEVKSNSKFIIGAVVVNHILSAFSAGKKTAAYNRSISMMDDVEINTYTLDNGSAVDGLGISITARF